VDTAVQGQRGQGGGEVLPLPKEVKEAMDSYLKLDRTRRDLAHSVGEHAYIFQPHTNYRTLDFGKALSTRMVQKIVKKWADYSRLGDLSPHNLRRTAIRRALESGLNYRQVQMMSKHKDPKTVMRYDHGRENLEQSAVNLISVIMKAEVKPKDIAETDVRQACEEGVTRLRADQVAPNVPVPPQTSTVQACNTQAEALGPRMRS
jgi:integrase